MRAPQTAAEQQRLRQERDRASANGTSIYSMHYDDTPDQFPRNAAPNQTAYATGPTASAYNLSDNEVPPSYSDLVQSSQVQQAVVRSQGAEDHVYVDAIQIAPAGQRYNSSVA